MLQLLLFYSRETPLVAIENSLSNNVHKIDYKI